jgi:hypothetical protein
LSNISTASDGLLTGQDREEAISRAYVVAIAAAAGYVTATPDFDRDSIDLMVAAGGDVRPKIDLQLKATINLRKVGNNFALQLKKKNYDDLRVASMTPRLIVVLNLPKKEPEWLKVSVQRLVIKRCAYWASLSGAPPLPANQDTKVVLFPATNRFDVDGVRELMEMARTGVVR